MVWDHPDINWSCVGSVTTSQAMKFKCLLEAAIAHTDHLKPRVGQPIKATTPHP
jgi:hypothetical protein